MPPIFGLSPIPITLRTLPAIPTGCSRKKLTNNRLTRCEPAETATILLRTSFMDMRPRKIAATVRYRPWRGSQAAIMFLASNICWVSSGTVRARYCWLPRDVSGAKPGMKKCRRGNGTMLTASLRKSAFNYNNNHNYNHHSYNN